MAGVVRQQRGAERLAELGVHVAQAGVEPGPTRQPAGRFVIRVQVAPPRRQQRARAQPAQQSEQRGRRRLVVAQLGVRQAEVVPRGGAELRSRGVAFPRARLRVAARAAFATRAVGELDPPSGLHEQQDRAGAVDLEVVGVCGQHQHVATGCRRVTRGAHSSSTPWLVANGDAASTSVAASAGP